jgi:hypothetical protein
MSRMISGRVLALALLVLAGVVPAAVAAFTATQSNSGNSFTSAAIFPGAIKMATGSYTGNGADNVPVTVGFQPDFVMVKDTNTREGVGRTSTMAANAAKPMGTLTTLQGDTIQSFTATGFVIGTNNRVNQFGRTYHWVAFKANTAAMKVGTYNGTGAAQPIGSMGFSPELVIVLGATAQRAVLHFAGGRTYRFDTGTSIASGVTSMDPDGFTVGTALETNAATIAYHYVAFNDVANSIDVSSYAGDAADPHNVGGVGFQPEYALIRADDNVTGRPATHRPASLAGDNTLFFAGSAMAANRIQALQADGFQLGSSGDVNANLITYRYLAVRSSAP